MARVDFLPLQAGPRPLLKFHSLSLRIEEAIQPAVLKSLLHPMLTSLTHNLQNFTYHQPTPPSSKAHSTEGAPSLFHLPTYLALLPGVAPQLTSFHHSSKYYFFTPFAPFLSSCKNLIEFTYTSPLISWDVLNIILAIPSPKLQRITFRSKKLNSSAAGDFIEFLRKSEGDKILWKDAMKGLRLCWVQRREVERWRKLEEACKVRWVELEVEFDSI